MNKVYFLLSVGLFALATSIASASDPSPLQDFCVATNDPNNVLFVNGRFCKDPNLAKADDFFYSGLDVPGNTSNRVRSIVTTVSVDQVPGLNTLGLQLERIDFGSYGLNPPHIHPRGSEILVVLEGQLFVGFVSHIKGVNRFFSKLLNKGDVFVFPLGLIHFQFDPVEAPAVAYSAFSSQNPGEITIANALFGSDPPITPAILAKSLQLDKDIIKYLQKQPWFDNH